LLHVDYDTSHELTNEITIGDLVRKPGWIRMSIHPTTTNAEIEFVCDAIIELSKHHQVWKEDYHYDRDSNEFIFKNNFAMSKSDNDVESWFDL
jgi:hypothetical protein